MAAPAPAVAEGDWESSKENFQPLKAGRKGAALQDCTAELRSKAIEERRRGFWEELAAYSGNDPLEVWLRFIKWTQETFSAGGHKAELLPLLERCTRELQGGGRYASDIRYLRLWIQYADCLPDPADVFSFLKENGIGQEHALYYVAFATYSETRGAYAQADAVYQQGINRLAAPVDRLRAKFQEFQQRMARRIQRKAAEQSSLEGAEADNHPERQSLGFLGGRKAAPAGGGGRAGAAGGSLKRKAAAAAAAPDAENAPGSGLAIFVDDEFSADGGGGAGGPAASAPAAFFQPGRSAAAASWTKLGGFEAGRKENVQRAGMWAGQKVKQAAAHSAPAAAPLEVFADPELEQELPLQAAASAAAEADAGDKPTLRQRLDKAGQAGPEEELMHNPLQLHTAARPPLPGGIPARGGATEGAAPEAKRRREESLFFDEAALIDSSGAELCFEEVRAARWQQLRAQEAAAAAAAENAELPDMDIEGDTCAVMLVAAAAAGNAAVRSPEGASPMGAAAPAGLQQAGLSSAAAGTFGSPVAAVEAPAAVAAEQAAKASLGAASPHPDVSMAATEQVLASPSPSAVEAGAVDQPERRNSFQQAAAEQAAAEEAATEQAAAEQAAAEQAAAEEAAAEQAAAEQASAEQAAAEQAAAEQAAAEQAAGNHAALVGGYEPTMTLNTRDAFAAINRMFGGSLPADAAPADLFGGFGSGGDSGTMAAACLDPTMTIATKDAFAALNTMFKGSLPLEHGSLPPNPHTGEPTLSFGRGGGFGGGGSAGMLDPTMTISTKAAFEAINSMFKGSLAHEHGSLPPTSRGPAAFEPTVTISTKAAFEALNQMFGGGGMGGSASTTGQPAAAADGGGGGGGFRVPAPRPPKARPAAAATAAAVSTAEPDSPDGFSIREDTVFVSVPLLAGDDGDEADDCSPAAAPGSSAGGGGGFSIREDTMFVSVPAGAGGAAGDSDSEGEDEEALSGAGAGSPGGSAGLGGGGFSIREDTMFVSVPVLQADSDCEEEEQAQQQADGRRSTSASPPAAGSAVLAPAGGLFGGFAIHEDTQFIGLAGGDAADDDSDVSPQSSARAAAAARLPRKRPLAALSGSTGSLGLGSGDFGSHAGSPAHSGGGAMQMSKWGFAPGVDDTLALQLGDTQALLEAVSAAAAADPVAAAQLQSAAGLGGEDGTGGLLSPLPVGLQLEQHLEGLQLSDCKENLMADPGAPAGGGSCGRRLADPGVAAAALQPLSEARAAGLGLAMVTDAAAEAALAAGAGAGSAELAPAGGGEGQQQGDSFMVWADGEGDSPPLMASPAASAGADSPPVPTRDAYEQDWLTPVQPQQEQQQGEGAEAAPLVDPFSPTFQARMLACLEPAVSEWPGVYCMTAEEEEAAEAGLRAAGRASSGLVELQLCGLEFAVSGCIGEGAYARVYQGVDGDCADVALKAEAPPCPWEWYICKALAGRVPAEARRHFINPSALLLGGRGSVLVAPLGPQGSLQDLVNAYLAKQQTPPEGVAMHFAAELLRILSHLHSARVLHADLKPDNLLVTLDAQQEEAGDEENAGGPALGLQLIDFGRSLDLELLPPGTLLQGDSGTDAFRCVEMREGQPWLWQADAYGAAATVHTLLYGRYMEVERVRENATGLVSLRLRQPFKRQWAGELWGAFFHRLLNHTDEAAPPAVDDLIAGFEGHLTGSREAARRLRQELGAVAALLPRHC